MGSTGGGSTGASTFWTKAAAARVAAPVPTTMTSPPTVSVSAANAGTAISGGTRIQPNNPAYTYLGCGMFNDGSTHSGFSNTYVGSAYLTTPNPRDLLRVEFESDTDKMEVQVQPTSPGVSTSYRIQVDGQWVNAAVQSAGLTSAGNFRITIDFGSRANRRVLFEARYVRFVGVTIGPTSTIWKSNRPFGPTVVVVGDSFAEGSGANTAWDAWCLVAGRYLGWNVIPSAVGATSYLQTPGGGKVKYRDRFLADVVPFNPDAVLFSGGYNDIGNYSADLVQAEARQLFALCRSSLPSARMFVLGPFGPAGIASAGSVTQQRDGLRVEAARVGATFADPPGYPDTQSWTTGSGYVGATNGTGNSDFNTTTDATHPSQAGHDYLGRRVAAAFLASAA